MAKEPIRKSVETITHDHASRRNIPTAEYQSVMFKEEQTPIRVAYERRNRDLDPQLVWRGKDDRDWSDLVVQAPPLYIQEKLHPKVLIDDLVRQTEKQIVPGQPRQINLFADFNGLPSESARTEFYRHEANWSNRMILGDSLQVMASLVEREGLRGKVQCIYIDPPYGIKFNSNFQWSTTSRDVKDGNTEHITREPEQVRAFRDTWRDGIHSYLTYLRDRLTVARDLLADTGSIFVQIGDENVHRIRALMDEVFGEENFCSLIGYKKTTGAGSPAIGTDVLASVKDYIVWFARKKRDVKYRQLYFEKETGGIGAASYNRVQSPDGADVKALRSKENYERDYKGNGWHLVASDNLTSQTGVESTQRGVPFQGREFKPAKGGWKTNMQGLERLKRGSRLTIGGIALRYVRRLSDFAVAPINNDWGDTSTGSFTEEKIYAVQSGIKAVQRCLLMSTDPGDLVLDPTCGSGTTAYVAEQWGRRWITIDTSRVALALARARIMGARYSYYLLADSKDGQLKEAEVTQSAPSETPTHGNIRQGFVYERVPHITLKSIANNTEIDVVWEKFQETMEPLRDKLNKILGKKWEEWEIPRDADDKWTEEAGKLHAEWWRQRIARQKEIDASIAANADFEYLYDKPYEDKKKVRVSGPFTVESLSPHRVLTVDADDELIDGARKSQNGGVEENDFTRMILENLKAAGVQQAHKEDKIDFTSITPWPGHFVCAEGRYVEGDEASGTEKRAAIFIGPEFGTVSRPDLVAAAREAGDADFDALITCAFNYDAHSADFDKLGRIPVLKARMNADLHMADDLKNTGKGNLFVIFGEPDIDILDAENGQIRVKINGVDVFHPNTGEVRSDGAEGIACWFIDTDYNEESFFVRHAYFLRANDPYKSLKTTLRAEINEEAWESLRSDTSRPFDKPKSGRIAVKVINHLGDEVMKVFRV
ncbi:site-specific DNA-methyltransferase [Syntrophobacter fumaroxidans]|uniref:site-specific DNA-methyltransferase (adenine-specific) n=1 Tax=Syntrophobacter fumaroxidans (strain DSM 10017 / MPOB) TaxID=335543 RepID=A0LM81_SYNFM|nr:site-specific DNA-methyltransferase [Syntrophobacter fumaroxidans]ABK18533.1 DNA methylase N-4/N-6 domain protein [Syntrophobacter fumaroxidans MPOB]